MIHSICQQTAEKLGRKLQADQDQISVYTYGLEIILETVVKFSLIAILAALCGILGPTLFFLAAFSVFRWLGGGVHMSSFIKCLVIGLILSLGMGFASTWLSPESYLFSLYLLAAASAVYVIWKWVPAGTSKKQIHEHELRMKQKKESFLAFIIWNLVVLFCIYNHLFAYALAAVLGSLSSSFFIMPMGYQFIEALDQITIWKGGMEDV